MNFSTHRLSCPSMRLLIQSLAQGAGAASLQVCTTLLTISLRTPAAAVCESCFLGGAFPNLPKWGRDPNLFFLISMISAELAICQEKTFLQGL